MALGTAFRAFFAALSNQEVARQLKTILDGGSSEAPIPKLPEAKSPEKEPPAAKPASRSDAITLLATLQREARLVDLVKENLSAYSDAQIGAAARPCLQQCAVALERVMSLQPIVSASDGSMIDVPDSAGPSRYQWLGEGSSSSGKLVHHGWKVDRLELPQWTGPAQDASVVAPVQVQRV
jgi:Domain of unknown function (DUF2760)